MKRTPFFYLGIVWLASVFVSSQVIASSQFHHGIALYGDLKYSADFTHTDYVNPDAPTGGTLRLAESGTFDSLNPYILKGVKAPGPGLMFETLMAPSLDEPSSYYGLIAEKIHVAEDIAYADFQLNTKARWHDDSPVTVEDVIFSLKMLREKASPMYRVVYAALTEAEKIGEHSVRVHFDQTGNRELPIIAASMPVLQKKYFDTHPFEEGTLDSALPGSGPYRVEKLEPGRTITYKQVENYWGKNIPIRRGMYNYAQVRFDMYRDENISLEALKAGQYDFRREYIARNWATSYESPAIRSGELVKAEIPDNNPQGMQGFFFNTRLPKFADRRVREAIALTLDFEWVNKTLFYGAYKRNTSFFKNTAFEATAIPEGGELAMLEPYRDALPESLFTDIFRVPTTDGSGQNRENLRKADALLNAAGWVIKDGKRINSATGEYLTVEFLMRQPSMARVAGPMRRGLERLGVDSNIRYVDDAQYQKRLDEFDFELTSLWININLFYPGNEQIQFWHSEQAGVSGSNNIAGAKHPAVDAALEALIAAKHIEELRIAGRALDRVLLWEHYVIPHWHSGTYRIAYWNKFGMPKTQPKYDMGLFTWWVKGDETIK